MPISTVVFSSTQHAEDVKALKKDIGLLLRRLEEMTRDRDEWREQHENLLAIYQAEVGKSAATPNV